MSKDLSKFSNDLNSPPDQGVDYERPLVGLRLLLVDDSLDNRTLTKYMLSSLGAELDDVDDGKVAVQLVSQHNFDAVVMDLRMPGYSGDQAAAEMRKIGFANPIIGITAHLGLAEKERCDSSGITDCLERPVSRSKLASAILTSLQTLKVKK